MMNFLKKKLKKVLDRAKEQCNIKWTGEVDELQILDVLYMQL